MKLSLRYKILGVLGLCLLSSVALYTLLASSIFRQEKKALLLDINHSVAVNTAAQLRSSLLQLSDHMKIYLVSQFLTESGGPKLSSSFLKESKISNIEILRPVNGKYIKLFAVIPYRGDQESLHPTPRLEEASRQGASLWFSSSPPRYFLATKVELEVSGTHATYLAVAELDSQAIFQAVQSASLFRSYLVKPEGEVLLHCEKSEIRPPPEIPEHPLLATLSKRQNKSGVEYFEYDSSRWYGAYAPVEFANLFFITQANEAEVKKALSALLKRSILFGIIVLSATFLAGIVFSRELTSNLKILTERALRIGQGELDTKIQLRSGDEVGTLANSFNKMIDDLKKSRDEIEKTNRELEQKVEDRTQELKEKNIAIKEAQEKLLRTTQLAAVGEVAGRTAHEVLNPLTAILSRIESTRAKIDSTKPLTHLSQLQEIIEAWEKDYKEGGMENLAKVLQTNSSVQAGQSLFEEDLSNMKTLLQFIAERQDEVGGDLDFVNEQAERIHRIVNGMRELTRESSHKEEINCHEAIHDAISTMSDFLSKHGISLREKLEAPLDRAHLNKDEFIQILTNLIRNSFQATLAAAPSSFDHTIFVQTRNQGECLEVDILDRGIGVPEDKHEIIFEHGFTTKSPSEGTGIGLAVSRRYARAFGGEVELAYSDTSNGTCFRVTIPIIKEAQIKLAV